MSHTSPLMLGYDEQDLGKFEIFGLKQLTSALKYCMNDT